MDVDKFSKDVLKECFDPVSLEQIAKVDHIILVSSVTSVNACFLAFGEPGGVFGDPPPYDAQGHAYLEPENSEIIEGFRLWAEPKNQRMLPERGAGKKYGAFTMVISAHLGADVLRKLYAKASPTLGYFDWDTFFPATLKMIDEIGWGYINTPEEWDISIVITSGRRREGLLRLEKLLQAHSRQYRFVVLEEKVGTVEIKPERA